MVEKSKIIRYIILGSLFFIVAWLLLARGDIIEKNYQFNGIIEKITYNEKKTPTVIVNRKEYILFFTSWRFNDKMQQGDSLIKKRNSRIYKLVKHNSREVIFSGR